MNVREVVMAMCERRGVAFHLNLCGSSPPPSLSFFGLSLIMGFWSHVCWSVVRWARTRETMRQTDR